MQIEKWKLKNGKCQIREEILRIFHFAICILHC